MEDERRTSDERIKDSFEYLKKAIPGVYNTALEYPNTTRIFVDAVWSQAQTDREATIKWLNKNTDIHYGTDKRNS